ncbi:MAG: SWIM zinc finger family protein, partial [Ferruginibacter sp.]
MTTSSLFRSWPIIDALTQKARWSAQLLAGVMPQDIERAFAASGRRLFPFKLQEVRSECTCPDNRKGNLCKHVSAVYYLMGERFSEDPFVLFQLRGRTRTQLLSELAQRRRQLLA